MVGLTTKKNVKSPDYWPLCKSNPPVSHGLKNASNVERITLSWCHEALHIHLCPLFFNFQYCHYVAGLVGLGLSRLFSASELENPEVGRGTRLSNSMGLFLQKTNIIRDYLEDVVDSREFWPNEVSNCNLNLVIFISRSATTSIDGLSIFGQVMALCHHDKTPLLERKLAQICVTIWRHLAIMT